MRFKLLSKLGDRTGKLQARLSRGTPNTKVPHWAYAPFGAAAQGPRLTISAFRGMARLHKRAWKTPPREIALRRLARAEALGLTYRQYTLEILERGRYL